MMLDVKTLQVLKNFSLINPSIIFKPGQVVSTISPGKTVMAKAKVATTFEKQFAIYDLIRFISAVTMFEDAEVELGETAATIGKGKEKIRFIYSEPSLITAPPEREIHIGEPDIEFELTNDMLTRILKAMPVVGAPEIAVTGRDGTIYLEAIDSKVSGKSSYQVEVGPTDKNFQMVFSADNIKLLPLDYKVSISKRGISHFKSEDVEYWITLEANSRFDG